MMHRNYLAILTVAGLHLSVAGAADFRMHEESSASGITGFVQAPGMGSGVAVADFNGDGYPDIFLPTALGSPNLLFQNSGDGTFVEVASGVGLADMRQARVALWLDYDGDGDLDLAVGRDCINGSGNCQDPILSLFEQNAGVFNDISTQVGLNQTVIEVSGDLHNGGLSAGDISGDGLPDIYFARWQAQPELYISDGLALRGDESGYIYGAASSGVGSLQAGHWQSLIQDLDGDHWPDLFVNVDFIANQLWINNQDNTFADVATSAGVDSPWNEMGLATGDYDNDGDLDFYITNIHDWVDPIQGRQNRLYRNDSTPGNLSFVDVSEAEGVDDTDWGWGTVWFDADNDGDLDLAATNGFCQADYCGVEHLYDQSRLFDRTDAGYADVSTEVGFNDILVGGSLISADFDGDGRLDLIQTAQDDTASGHIRLLFNRPAPGAPENHFIAIKPRLPSGNTHALGALVRVTLPDDTVLTRHISAGSSWIGQEPALAHFGIGSASYVKRVEVIWPNGGESSTWAGLHIDRTHEVCCRDTWMVDSFE